MTILCQYASLLKSPKMHFKVRSFPSYGKNRVPSKYKNGYESKQIRLIYNEDDRLLFLSSQLLRLALAIISSAILKLQPPGLPIGSSNTVWRLRIRSSNSHFSSFLFVDSCSLLDTLCRFAGPFADSFAAIARIVSYSFTVFNGFSQFSILCIKNTFYQRN